MVIWVSLGRPEYWWKAHNFSRAYKWPSSKSYMQSSHPFTPIHPCMLALDSVCVPAFDSECVLDQQCNCHVSTTACATAWSEEPGIFATQEDLEGLLFAGSRDERCKWVNLATCQSWCIDPKSAFKHIGWSEIVVMLSSRKNGTKAQNM